MCEPLAYLPFGQQREVPDAQRRTQATAVKACKEKLRMWPSQVPSFELWAAATKYERGQPGGGPAFRTMMRLLLVEGDSSAVDTKAKPHVTATLPAGRVGTEWKRDDENVHMHSNATQHTPRTQGKLKTKAAGGFPNGVSSSEGTGFKFEEYDSILKQQTVVVADGYESRASIKPLSKVAWAKFCLGLADPAHGNNSSASAGKHGSHTSFSSAHRSDSKSESCNEVSKRCLSLGNQLASIFGLYYYKGCDEPANNWMVKQTLGSKVYFIRMRAWNPAYTMKEVDGVRRLLVKELLNKQALDEEEENQLTPSMAALPADKRFVGSHEESETRISPGFWLPTVAQYNGKPLQPSHVICQRHRTGAVASISSALAPWFGKTVRRKPPEHSYAVCRAVSQADPKGNLAANLGESLGDLVMQKTKGDDGISLGFVAPKAHWLYPHHIEQGSKLEFVPDGVPGNGELQGAGAYQPCPQWHGRYKDTLTGGCMVPNTEESLREIKKNGLYYVTDLFEKEKARLNQIRYALNDDALQYDAEAAQAVAAMLAGHKSATNMTPADELQLDKSELTVARLRVMAKAVDIATTTYNSETNKTSLITKIPLLATLRAHYGVVIGAPDPAEPPAMEPEPDTPPPARPPPARPPPARRAPPARPARPAPQRPPSPVPETSRGRTLRSRANPTAAADDDVIDAEDEAVSDSERPQRNRRRRPTAVAEPEVAPDVADADDEEDPENRVAQQHEFITEDTANTRPTEFEYNDYNQEVIVVLENATLNDMETGEENKEPTETTDERFRFESQSKQPWPHGKLYQTPRIEIVANDLRSAVGLQNYKRKYGSTANLYVGGRKIASDLLDRTAKVKMQYGEAHLQLMKSKLFCSDTTHKEQMLRILRIYADPGRFGRHASNLDLSAEQKRDGFNFGVALGAGGQRRKAPSLDCLSAKYKPNSGAKRVLLWKPVFGTPPPSALCKAILAANSSSGAPAVTCQTRLFVDWYNKKEHRAAGSMTVQEWLSTPWQYNSLPLERHAVMFRDGECYSEGCRRCGRPFFEYEWRYAWTRLSVPGTAGFTQRLWRPDDAFNRTECAPRPFDDPCFWKKPKVSRELDTRRSSTAPFALAEDAPFEVGGADAQKQMNWELYAFQYGPHAQDKSALSHEWSVRKGRKAETQVAEAAKEGLPVVYRQYWNHCYSAERAKAWDGGYPVGVACRASGANARVQAGQQEYRLARCAKYGNLCVDCAATLYAAKRLDRSHEGSKYAAKSVERKRKERVRRSAAAVLSEWQTRLKALKTATGEWAEGVLTLSPADMAQLEAVYRIPAADPKKKNHTLAEDAQMRQRSKQVAAAVLPVARAQQAMPLTAHLDFNAGEVQFRTMYKEPPEFYIQKHFPWRGMNKAREVPQDRDDILEALQLLDQMFAKPVLDAAKPKGKRTSLAASTFWTDAEHATARTRAAQNVALQHMLAELHRRYVHLQTHTEAPVERFDMNWRKELRNEKVADPRAGHATEWQNCLVVCTPQPEKEGATAAQGRRQGGSRKFTTEKVYYHSKDKTPADGKLETMWRGDKYVIHRDGAPVQWRERRQSRLFITYSLHRAITGEDEGRFVLARMAAACDYVFGNETELAKLLVFGYKVVGPPTTGRSGAAASETRSVQSTDAISRGALQVIEKFRKQDKQDRFYGNGKKGHEDSSYTSDTYETHVESVIVDGGVEIGPQRHLPHFHVLLTVNHYSLVTLDYYRMAAVFEVLFKGKHETLKDQFKLYDSSGGNFFTDNENAYVDVRLFPQDNWNTVIANYVRKSAVPDVLTALQQTHGAQQ